MKLTKAEITAKFRAGEIDAEERLRLMKESDRKPPRFAVAEKSGWLSIYFDGLRFEKIDGLLPCVVELSARRVADAAEIASSHFLWRDHGNENPESIVHVLAS